MKRGPKFCAWLAECGQCIVRGTTPMKRGPSLAAPEALPIERPERFVPHPPSTGP